MLNAAIIGFGGIAKSHRKAYAKLAAEGKVRLVAAYDIDPEAFTRRVKINLDTSLSGVEEEIRFYTDLDEMLAKEKIDLFSVCVPSFRHAEITEDLLRRGYHVLCEKPMALNYADCERMIRAAEESGKELMIGQCLRFYPAFDYIKAVVDDGRFGRVLGGFFERLSAPPVWGWENWFMDPARSGGCITDLHIHDVDVIRYLFGEPEAVSCHASTSVSVHDTVHTTFFYENGTPITAVGDWSLTGISFRANCRLNFEKATVTFDGKTVTVYPKDGSDPYEVELAKVSGHEGEISYFCDVIEGRRKNDRNPASSAARTVALIETMRESVAENGKPRSFVTEGV